MSDHAIEAVCQAAVCIAMIAFFAYLARRS